MELFSVPIVAINDCAWYETESTSFSKCGKNPFATCTVLHTPLCLPRTAAHLLCGTSVEPKFPWHFSIPYIPFCTPYLFYSCHTCTTHLLPWTSVETFSSLNCWVYLGSKLQCRLSVSVTFSLFSTCDLMKIVLSPIDYPCDSGLMLHKQATSIVLSL